MFSINYLKTEMEHELSAARCQVRRLECLAKRLVSLDLKTDDATSCHAFVRLAQLLKASQAFVGRIENDLEALSK